MGQDDTTTGSDREEVQVPWNGEERRRGPRRVNPAGTVDIERRQGDRRKRSPGLKGLLRAILGDDQER